MVRPETIYLLHLIKQVRVRFEQGRIDPSLLAQLYQAYNPITDIDLFIDRSVALFPHLNCGLASLFLKHVLAQGEVHRGRYKEHAHTFLLLKKNLIVDITADQYGGPKIYYGLLKYPWAN